MQEDASSLRAPVAGRPGSLAVFAVLGAACVGVASAADWPQFGYDPAHSGNNPDETTITAGNVRHLAHLYTLQLSTSIDAAPIYRSGVVSPGGTRDVVFLELSDGTFEALDVATGTILWSKKPLPPRNTSPTTAATPAIDPSRNYVYAYGLDGNVHKYSVVDGAETIDAHWPIVSTLKPDVEHGASALTIGKAKNGVTYLYAVTNGFNGDGGDYQGHVTTINLGTGYAFVFNAVCSNLALHFVYLGTNGVDDCATLRAGIWGRSGATFDATLDRFYIATANGNYDANVGGYNWGDSVLALNTNGAGASVGTPLDSYTPAQYYNMDLYDLDFGSGAVAILPSVPGSKFPHLGVIHGKETVLRLLNLDDLSGNHAPRHVGGELQLVSVGGGDDAPAPQPAVWTDVHGDGAVWLFVASWGVIRGLKEIVDAAGTPSLQQQWLRYISFGTSPIVANDVLFAGSPTQALDPRTGAVLWTSSGSSSLWGQPIVADGRLILAGASFLTVYWIPTDRLFADGFE